MATTKNEEIRLQCVRNALELISLQAQYSKTAPKLTTLVRMATKIESFILKDDDTFKVIGSN